MKNKENSGFIQIIIIILVVLALTGVYYFGIKNKFAPTPIPVASVQPSSSPTASQTPNGDLANWKTYVNRSDPKSVYSISFPVGWVSTVTKTVDPNYPEGQNISDRLLLEKDSKIITIDRPEASGPSVCEYPDLNFVEFMLGSRTARISKLDFQMVQGIDHYNICQKGNNSNTFVSITEFGYIGYDVPANTPTEDIEEINSIIKTLKKG